MAPRRSDPVNTRASRTGRPFQGLVTARTSRTSEPCGLFTPGTEFSPSEIQMVVGPASDTRWTNRAGDPNTRPESAAKSAAAFCNATGSLAPIRIVACEDITTSPDAHTSEPESAAITRTIVQVRIWLHPSLTTAP